MFMNKRFTFFALNAIILMKQHESHTEFSMHRREQKGEMMKMQQQQQQQQQ